MMNISPAANQLRTLRHRKASRRATPIDTLAQLFASTPECRRLGGNFRYPMHEIVTILFLARLRNITSSRKTAIWANENIDELRRHGLELRHGAPSHHTFSRVLAKMPPTVLKALERRWSEELRKRVAGTFVALDGKALKHASTDGAHVPYVVSAWSCEGGFVMGEVKTDVKSNEITALPVLLTTLGRELEGCAVSIDAADGHIAIQRSYAKARSVRGSKLKQGSPARSPISSRSFAIR